MRRLASLLCLALLTGPACAGDDGWNTPKTPEPVTALAKDFMAGHEDRMPWWREARFGMFIHWGVYSVPGGNWNGKNYRGYSEWLMHMAKIPTARYRALPAQFNPTQFDAKAWVQLAKDAGMKYIVFTAKHHDGFAMFRTAVDGFNIVDATPWKRDPLAELAKEAQAAGIKLGVYYSQAQDWNHPGGAIRGGKAWDAAQAGDMDAYIDQVALPQVKELLSNYPVSILWLDTPMNFSAQRGDRLLPLLKLRPGVIMNNRLVTTRPFGDFDTPEQEVPPAGVPGQDWETCMTMNDSWGYNRADHHWKSSKALLHHLIDIASKGGNFLLNVGPSEAGEIPAASQQRLHDIGAWLKVNGDAIYGTSATPFAQQMPWGRITQRVEGGDSKLYLHVFDWPKNGKLMLPRIDLPIVSVSTLADGAALTATPTRQGTAISVPAKAPDPISSTIVIQLRGTLQAQKPGATP